ncbi:MAG: hypothetical protein ABEJ36_00350 [Candidatus Nanosalina sp.]
MNLRKILVESFRMLLDRPKLFVPKLVSTSISTLWILSLGLNFSNPASVTREAAIFYLASAPLMILLGVTVSVMLAKMVQDEPHLRKSFLDTLRKWRSLLGVTTGILLAGVGIYIPSILGFSLYVLTGTFTFLIAGAAVSFLLMLLVSYSIFFLPISLVESSGLGESIREAVGASRRNSREVTLLLMMSFVLLGVAFTMQGTLQKLGILGFILSRLTSAVTTTYLFVVSPNMYLNEEGK